MARFAAGPHRRGAGRIVPRRGLEAPFVGRTASSASAGPVPRLAETNAEHVVAVSGPGGIGKSSRVGVREVTRRQSRGTCNGPAGGDRLRRRVAYGTGPPRRWWQTPPCRRGGDSRQNRARRSAHGSPNGVTTRRSDGGSSRMLAQLLALSNARRGRGGQRRLRERSCSPRGGAFSSSSTAGGRRTRVRGSYQWAELRVCRLHREAARRAVDQPST